MPRFLRHYCGNLPVLLGAWRATGIFAPRGDTAAAYSPIMIVGAGVQAFNAAGMIEALANTLLLIPTAMAFEAAREYLFRTVSQITLNYRDRPLSLGAAGHVHGGGRLPWVPIERKDNFEPLAAMTWQVHVYGSASTQLADWCGCHDVPLHVFEWRPAHEAAGLARNALYLLRPDTYVALADPSGAPEALERYWACTRKMTEAI